jgi:hypothetical protein
MSNSTNLILPFIEAAQAQKHVTHNEALQVLDAVVQLMVLDKDLATPPGSPADGDRYIVASSPTGAWTGHTGHVAAYQDGAWAFSIPKEGWWAWAADEDKVYVYTGSAWIDYAANLTQFGLKTANGGQWQRKYIEQSTTLSGATTDAATAIPIGIVYAVSCRVTTLITASGGGSSFSVGDGTTANKFGGSLPFTAGTTNRGHIGPTGYYSGTDPLRYTVNAGAFTGGVVRSVIWYDEFTPPTS